MVEITDINEKNHQNQSHYVEDANKAAAGFEKAIAAAGFGRFNLLLLLIAFMATIANSVEVCIISYILPSAECDLSLNLLDKGILNAITYCGMIISAIGWGYLSDKKGRKKLMVFGYFIDVVCILCCAMSQNIMQLMVSKFLGGLVISGPFAILMSYVTEFHGTEHRHRIMMFIGISLSLSMILMSVLALFILPNKWNFKVLNMNFYSWQVYIAICCIPSLVSGILLTLFPESPRFLMSQGRNAEALQIFQKIFAINKNQPSENYPIHHLINENPNHKDSDPLDNDSISAIKAAVSPSLNIYPTGFKSLLRKPYLVLCLLVNILHFFIYLGQHTMRLWLPQLFASMHEYGQVSKEATTSMCKILEYSVNKTELIKSPEKYCVVTITPATYSNNIIVIAIGLIAYLLAGLLINALGNKRIQVYSLVIAGTCGIAIFWSSSALMTIILTSLYLSVGSISSASATGTSVNLFPTSLRTMIVSLSMTFGRIGSITGNVFFPVFMSFGCIPPFLMIGGVMYFGAIISALLPSTNNIELK